MKHNPLYITLLATSLLFVGCVQQPAVELEKKVEVKPKPKVKAKPKSKYKKKKYTAPKAPKKNIKLKKVEDSNFSSEYMYPEAKKKKVNSPAVVKTPKADTPTTSAVAMSRGECISMIGQEKFDKYTQMLGSEASAMKKCKMLKSM